MWGLGRLSFGKAATTTPRLIAGISVWTLGLVQENNLPQREKARVSESQHLAPIVSERTKERAECRKEERRVGRRAEELSMTLGRDETPILIPTLPIIHPTCWLVWLMKPSQGIPGACQIATLDCRSTQLPCVRQGSRRPGLATAFACPHHLLPPAGRLCAGTCLGE